MYLNCLLQVSGDRPLELTEWLDYHLALGFDSVYVYDSGNRDWIDGICGRYGDKVRLMPRTAAGWTKRRDIVSDHLSKRKSPEWCVCLTDDEYVWIDLNRMRSIKQYVELAGMRTNSRAITGYYVYISAKGKMPNRTGTCIDCFLHIRKNPQGIARSDGRTLFGGETFFLYDRIGMQPLAGPIAPTCAEWVDANGVRLDGNKLNSVIAGGFNPINYAMRIYKYAIRSDKEMGYADGERPTGYTELDLSMQTARKALLGVPVEQQTEELFTKPLDFDEAEEALVNGPSRTETIYDVNIPGLPITKAKMDRLILEGNYFEDIVDYLDARGLEYGKEALMAAFNAERQVIADSSPVYKQVQTLIDENKSVKEISAITGIAVVTLDKMAATLRVLDINTGIPSADTVARAVSAFERSEELASMSVSEIEQNDARFAEIAKKRAEIAKKNREARKQKQEIPDKSGDADVSVAPIGGGLDAALDALGVGDEMPSPDIIAELEKKVEISKMPPKKSVRKIKKP